ncbi:MAG: YlxR family protein [Mycoplasma sp.]|nr:YlxR family protein [Mycoplasma sp.]
MKTNNIRKCIATGEKIKKSDLIKIVKFKNEITIDYKQNKPGRSCYIKNDINVIDKLIKQKLLHKNFKQKVNEKLYKEITQIIKGGKDER